jgi:hypothetical protein
VFSVAVLNRNYHLAEVLANGVRELGRIHVGPLELPLEPADPMRNRGSLTPTCAAALPTISSVLRLRVIVSRMPVDSSPRTGV